MRPAIFRSFLMTTTAGALLATSGMMALAADNEKVLEEIVVTARKREERLQSVPISVAAFNSAALEAHQVFNVNELAKFTPNLQYAAGASGLSSSSNFFIRGIGQDDFITTTEPGVGIYLDGVYLARVTGSALDLADIERVEVLRGPQGTLFGRNTIGGAVNVVTSKPTGELGGKAAVRMGNQGVLEGKFLMNFPVVKDVLAAKVAFLGRRTSGWGKNIWPGAQDVNLGAGTDIAGRLQVRWQTSERVTVDLSADITRTRGTTMPHGMVDFVPSAATAAFNATTAVPIGPQWLATNAKNVQLNTDTRSVLNVWGLQGTVTVDFDSAKLKLITAYREQNGTNGQDFDGTPATFIDQRIVYDQWQFSQEAQIVGSAFGNKLDYAFGLYFFTEEGQFDSDVVLTDIPILIFTGNKTDSYAAYGQASYHLTDRFSITAGARWTKEKKFMDARTLFGPFELIPFTKKNETFSAWSPKVGLEFQASDDLMFYTSVTRGFRSGGFNGRAFSPIDLTPFKEETATSYEGGFKSEWLDRRLRLNGAVFYNDYKDIQVVAVTTDADGNFIVVTGNSGKAKIYGAELELQAQPTQRLNISAGVGYLHNSVSGQPGFSIDATTLNNSPKWTVNLGSTYTAPLSNFGEMEFGANYYYNSGYLFQFGNAEKAAENGFDLISAHITIRPSEGAWELTFYGKNLANEVYRTYGQTSGTRDTTIAWFGRSRELGAELRFNW
jgi:iron complex outermembrane receptor protein